MARLSCKVRVCKWVGTVGCALVVLAAMWSACCSSINFVWKTDQHVYWVSLWNGLIRFARGGTPVLSMYTSGWHLWFRAEPLDALRLLAAFPSVTHPAPPTLSILNIPLWVPLLVLLVPTLVLWRRERRLPEPGSCLGCGYDLTGNVSGICPECGMEIVNADSLKADG